MRCPTLVRPGVGVEGQKHQPIPGDAAQLPVLGRDPPQHTCPDLGGFEEQQP
ncbi:hypothetical protein [Mycobacterium persicum]|uniref:hypothetical protein n=1 Tax=Mycobacterium persicum TaxID=1487726 RepID=UPI0030B8756F